jgi:hypothetical protein
MVSLFTTEAAFFFGGAVMAAGIPAFLWLTRGAVVAETVTVERREVGLARGD